MAIHALGSRGAEAGADLRLPQQTHHAVGEGRAVVRLDQEARAAVLDHLAERRRAESNHRLAARHGLLRRERESLEERGKNEDVGEVQHGNLVGLGQVAGEDHRALEAEFQDVSGDRTSFRGILRRQARRMRDVLSGEEDYAPYRAWK